MSKEDEIWHKFRAGIADDYNKEIWLERHTKDVLTTMFIIGLFIMLALGLDAWRNAADHAEIVITWLTLVLVNGTGITIVNMRFRARNKHLLGARHYIATLKGGISGNNQSGLD